MANEKRLIDANELKKKISANFEQCFYSPFCEIQIAEETIDDAPTVDAVEVVHGRWIHDYNNLYGCSVCMERETMSPKKLKKYCPNCGAKMDGDGNE